MDIYRDNNVEKKGFTIVEVIITMALIGIIAGVTSGILLNLMQLFVYLPREMKARTIAHDVMELMIEGEPQRRGMRYAVEVQDASSTQFTYTFGYPGNTDKRIMRFRWDSAAKKLYRSYTAFGSGLATPPELPNISSGEQIPYYASGEISINGPAASPNIIFRYFKEDGTELTPPAPALLHEIRRVEISIVVKTGTGLFRYWDSSFQTTSSAEIRQYR